jgi:hypothetical protein
VVLASTSWMDFANAATRASSRSLNTSDAATYRARQLAARAGRVRLFSGKRRDSSVRHGLAKLRRGRGRAFNDGLDKYAFRLRGAIDSQTRDVHDRSTVTFALAGDSIIARSRPKPSRCPSPEVQPRALTSVPDNTAADVGRERRGTE